MAELPHMPLATDAYLGDTRHLTTLEHGAYLLLLMIAWRVRGRPCLPNDDKLLARFSGCDPRTWKRIKPTVMAFWDLGADGVWTQKKQLEMRERVNKNVEKMRNISAARWGAKPLENNDTHDACGYPTKTKTINSPKVPKGTGPKNGYGDDGDAVFARFLSEVWNKRWQREGHNRLKAYLAYSRLSEADRASIAGRIERTARHLTESRSEAKYRPMLQSWLNARGWEADTPQAIAPTTDWVAWVRHHKATGEWNPVALGPAPGQPGCRVPPELIIAPAA